MYENWEKLSDADRSEIERLFLKLEELGKLEELLAKEYFAKKLYEEKLLPILPPRAREFPKHKYLSDEEVKEIWKEFEAYSRLRMPEVPEPRIYMDRFLERIKNAKTKQEAIDTVKRLVDEIVREKRKIAPPPPAPPTAPPTIMRMPKRLIAVRECPKCGGVARLTTMTERNPLTGEFEIRGKYVCAKCRWASEWETVGFLV